MNSVESLATFFGWCTVISFAILMLAVLFFGFFHEWAAEHSANFFGITNEEAKATFFRVFHQYRLAFVMLNVVPYIALKIMSKSTIEKPKGST